MSFSDTQNPPVEDFSQAPPVDDFSAPVSNMPNPEDVAKVRASGWTEGIKLDYDVLKTGSQPIWASSAAVYEWTGEEGEVGPADEELEKILFDDDARLKVGHAIKQLEIEAYLEGPNQCAPVTSFKDAGLHPVVLENVSRSGYTKTTVIQAYCIPLVLKGLDVVAIAQTGSGKTAAYLIPIVSQLMGKVRKLRGPHADTKSPDYDPRRDRVRAEPLVLIIVPTRELAQQVFNEARRMCYRSMLRPVCVYGGVPTSTNIAELTKGCDILIGTVGRLKDLMGRPEVLSMQRIKFTVIDEADEMLDPSWEEDMNQILGGGDTNENSDHKYLMFSATFPKSSRAVAKSFMEEGFTLIHVGRAGSCHSNITQDIIYVDQNKKKEALSDLLFSKPGVLTLIICNSHQAVMQVDDWLYGKGFPTAFMHSGRTQLEREDALTSFRKGRTPILISTNLFGRGLDIPNVDHVINYDLPSTMHGGIHEYVHRIGRTGRIGNVGLATSFYNDRNEELAQDLVNILLETNQPIPDFLEQYKPEDGKPVFHEDDEDGDQDNYTTEGGADTSAGWSTEAAADTGAGWGTDGAAATSGDGWANNATATTGVNQTAGTADMAW